jgi:hypothetical protein
MKKKIQLVLITLFGVALIAVLVLQEAFLSIYDVDNLERLSEEVNYVLPTQGVPEVAIAIMRSRELITVSCLTLLFIVVILALFVILRR